MSKQLEFFIYLIERYADAKGVTGDVVLHQWDELGITDRIYDMYEIYHIERLQNAFDDIDQLIQESKPTNAS